MNVQAINAPPTWHTWGKVFWFVVIIVGAGLEAYAAFIDPKTPTFTGIVKEYVKWPIVRAAIWGALFYHFCIQPLYEALADMGVKVF